MVELLIMLMLAVVLIPIAMCCVGLWLGMQNKKELGSASTSSKQNS